MATTGALSTTADESATTESSTEPSEVPASAPAASPAEPRPLPTDQVFGLLSAARRRAVLTFLDENGGETTLSAVAEHIAAAENGIPVGQLSSAQRKRVYIGLYQCHLPQLADAYVVEYDQARGTIELRPEADQLFPHLALASSDAATNPPSDHKDSTWLHALATTLATWVSGWRETA